MKILSVISETFNWHSGEKSNPPNQVRTIYFFQNHSNKQSTHFMYEKIKYGQIKWKNKVNYSSTFQIDEISLYQFLLDCNWIYICKAFVGLVKSELPKQYYIWADYNHMHKFMLSTIVHDECTDMSCVNSCHNILNNGSPCYAIQIIITGDPISLMLFSSTYTNN